MNYKIPSNPHALITGGGTGIGLAIAKELKSSGAKVTVCGRNLRRLQEVSEAHGFIPIEMDVTSESSVKKATLEAEEISGIINIHVANAGIAEGMDFAEMDFDFWRKIMSTNLDGAYLSIKYSLASMSQGNWGRIIAISSVAGLRGLKGASAYTASKHALIGLVRGNLRRISLLWYYCQCYLSWLCRNSTGRPQCAKDGGKSRHQSRGGSTKTQQIEQEQENASTRRGCPNCNVVMF